MDQDELEAAATTAQLGAAVSLYQDELSRLHHMHEGGSVTERRVTYKGHDIRITTTYRIEMDGNEVTGHILVNNQGTVHYHAIPNQEFTSAVDLVKRIVDIADQTDEAPTETHHHHEE